MRVRIVTIFPGFFASCLGEGLLGKAAEKDLVRVEVDDLRGYATDKHRTVDDEPYGGGAGMVMKVDVWAEAIDAARAAVPGARVVLLSPQGDKLDDAAAVRLAREPGLVLCCGRYEGVDERVARRLVDEELSIGDYVLTGGEAAALVVLDAVARKLPGVVGRSESVETDSFTAGLKHPQFTRPPEFRGWGVPEVLLSGDHQAIARWRDEQARARTAARRPDLIGPATAAQVRLLLTDGDPAPVGLLAPLVEAFGLRELGLCIADAGKREEMREKKAPVRVYGLVDRAVSRWKDETFIHLARQAEAGQLAPAQVRQALADASGPITLSWGEIAPPQAQIAAPPWPSQVHDITALIAWLDRLFGRG